MRVLLYTKPACSLCDKLKLDLSELQQEFGFELCERNIEQDADDFARFRYLIPVLEIEEGPLLFPPHSREELARTLAHAGRSSAEQTEGHHAE